MTIISSQSVLIVDTEANLPATGVSEGTIAYAQDTKKIYKYNGSAWIAELVIDGLLKITVGVTEPTAPGVGDLFVDTTT